MALRLPRSLAGQIVARARVEAPDECWGLLAGTDGRVREVYHLANGAPAEDRPFRYETEFRSQAAAEQQIVDQGWDILGIYHSHTHTQPYPSPTDIDRANPLYGDIVYLIVSLRASGQPFVHRGMSEVERQAARTFAAHRPARPELRGWHIRDGRAEPADLRITRG
jgi:[CysO sulfur-carrier protein]-S-L-cysteine hydrolase